MKLVPTFDGLALASAAAFAILVPNSAAATAPLENPAQPTTEAGHLERVASFERRGSPTDPTYVEALTGLSLFYANQGNYAQAVPVLRRALAASERIFGPDHSTTREIRTTLLMAEAFVRQQR
jgi:hypothetical protein